MKKHFKSRQEIANEYGVSTKTLSRWLKKYNLEIGTGLLTPQEQALIYTAFGLPKEPNRLPEDTE